MKFSNDTLVLIAGVTVAVMLFLVLAVSWQAAVGWLFGIVVGVGIVTRQTPLS